jgi:alpha-tubulin suppressor-like RCC1 family protein
MMTKILFATFLIALVGCKPQSDFFELPVPANLQFGQTQTNPDADWLAIENYDFGRKPFASTTKSILYVKNIGNLAATIKSVKVEGAHPEYYSISYSCGNMTLASQGICPFFLTYEPTTVGSTPASVHVTYDNGKETVEKYFPIKASASNLAFLKFETERTEIKSNTIGYTLSSYFKVIYNGTAIPNNGFTIEPAKGVIISDPSNGAFTIDRTNSTCGEVIQADCSIKVDFSPSVVGLVSSTFNLNYYNGAEVLKITGQADGTGVAATVLATLSASAVDFGNVVVNPTTLAERSIPITFAGSVPADNIVIKGPTGAFTIDSNKSKTTCGTQIAGTCALYVYFEPTALTTYSSTITIEYTSNGQARSPLKFTLAGKGVNPAAIAADLQTLAYGSVPAYKAVSKKFTLTNSGDVAVSALSAITVSDTTNFSASFDSTCATLASKASCALTVSYKPKSAVGHEGTVSFTYNNGREVKTVKLAMNGTGTAPLVMEGSRTIDFGNVMIGNPTLPSAINSSVAIYGLTTLTNANQFVFNPTSLSGPFTFNNTVCKPPFDPKKSNSCVFGVALTTNTGMAADVAVTQAFTLTYSGDDKVGSGVLNFTAKMTPRVPPVLQFATVPTIDKISVNNSTSISLSVKNNSAYFGTAFRSAAVSGSDNFSITYNSCSGGVAANATCTITVKYTPKDVGTHTAKINLVYSNQIKDQTISADVSGTSSGDVTLTANATTVDFGSVYVGDVIAPKIIDIQYFGGSNWTPNISVTAPFKITPIGCGEPASCQLQIDYIPTASGTSNVAATFGYSPALKTPGVINLNLKGVAVVRAPVLSISPGTLAKTLVGYQTTQTLTVKNAGNTVAEAISLQDLSGVLVYAQNGGPGTTGNCAVGQNLKAGESCTVKVTYTPTKVGKQEIPLVIAYGANAIAKATVTAKINVIGTQMIQVFAGGYQTCILNELSQVVCWGRNTSGQLGQGSKATFTTKPQAMPVVQFEASLTASKIAVGDSHTCAIVGTETNPGRVVCWGNNDNGRLGIGDIITNLLQPTNSSTIIAVDLGLDDQGDKEEAVDIAAGFEHTCALLASGKVKCWGGNTSGQLGIDNKISVGLTKSQMASLKAVSLGRKAVAISAGAGHSCAVLDNGATKCWGDNFYGQLGAGSDAEKLGGQAGEMASINEIKLGSGFNAKEILASSGAFTCAVSTSGALKCFGKTVLDETSKTPFYGVLGNCFARSSQNTSAVLCNTDTQLAPTTSIGYLAGDMGDHLPKINVSGSSVDQISLGSSFVCALTADHQVKCFGSNDQGQLGVGSRTNLGATVSDMTSLPAALTAADAPVQIATGYEHACAVLANNTLRCWGSAFQNATGTTSYGVAGNTGVSATTVPSKLPLIYDGR